MKVRCAACGVMRKRIYPVHRMPICRRCLKAYIIGVRSGQILEREKMRLEKEESHD